MSAERVLVAMSGGVDSSLAAAMAVDAGHEVVGATLKLWGGPSDAGCCSVADVDDARRVADRLGIEHHTFAYGDEFERHVVAPYVAAHAAGRTPNPCIECNRHLKFDALLGRAERLGFDRIVTGHHARIVRRADGVRHVARGRDAAKDQSYVLHMLDQRALARLVLPIGELTKAQVRRRAADLGLATADKPDSQDVCFITAGGRQRFLAERTALHEGAVVDADGRVLGAVDAVELVTVGQRRGLHLAGGSEQRYAVRVDVAARTVQVGTADELAVAVTALASPTWADGPVVGSVRAQVSAHGPALPATVERDGAGLLVRWQQPVRRVAPGQSVVLYDAEDDERVLGGATAA